MSPFLLVLVGFAATAQCYPWHASCKIDWSLEMPCTDVKDKLVNQIKTWKGFTNCNSGEKCGYELVSETVDKVKATHTTPKKKYVDDLDFEFKETAGKCNIHAFSTSETWYAYLDFGTNYCNLHNLAEGAGLTKATGFKESTSDSVCTQFSSHNCDKY